jgi:hypothetical protein
MFFAEALNSYRKSMMHAAAASKHSEKGAAEI